MTRGEEFGKKRAKYRAAILYDTTLTLAARIIGYTIADQINPRSGDAWPSQERIGKRTNISVRTVRDAVKDLVKAGWFSTEIDGRGWRYVPSEARWAAGGRIPEVTSGIEGGSRRTEHRKLLPEIPEADAPLSSIKNQIDNEPEARAVPIRTIGASELIGGLARKQGAPSFVFQDSEPWKAWCDYRKRNGLPGSLPTRQQVIAGRLRTGWDVPTLWPPGYSREDRSA